MSDDGDKTCPLCAEEMDLTDQQLKPCKCGYEICVWCWHQIMDLAEKENTEGRCPACRTSYNKERIVGMAVNCERLMIESNTEKRYKTQKTKLKMSADARKNLSRVRVVQRNLVYVMGLPSHLADESVLERREYFGKYGKILKLSISRPTTTTQQVSSNCFSVYITYAREEDAVRCIQSVHNYTLEGKSLRASFGTTKYCHSWLRNMICSNPDCLYLHDIGCQEDSFTKDEIISTYSRSRVPQVPLNNLQRRAGNILPTPEDDIGTNRTASSKTCLRMSSNNTINHVKSANVSSGRSIVLPAAASWGSRVPIKCPPPTNAPYLQNPVEQKPDFFNPSTPFHSSVSSINRISPWDDHVSVLSKAPDNRAMDGGGSRTSEAFNHVSSMYDCSVVSDDSSKTCVVAKSPLMASGWDDYTTTKEPEERNIMHMDSQSSPRELLKVNATRDEMAPGVCKSTDIVFEEACNYAWDDDVDATSKQIKEPSFYLMDGKTTSAETLRCYSDRDSQTSQSEDAMVGDIPSTSSISCSSSQLLDTLTGDEDGLATHEIIRADSVNVKSLECNDSLSKRVNFDDVISNSVTPKEIAESVYLGISAVKFDSQLVVDHQSKDKYQIVSSKNCSNSSNGSSAVELYRNYPNREAERQSSVPSLASAVTDSQCFSGWASNRQSDDPLAMEKGDIYSFTNDDQKEKVSNVSTRTTYSSFYASMLPVVPEHDQQDDNAMQREVFETHEMRRTEIKPSYLLKSDDLTTKRTENNDTGEGSIISNMLSLDFNPWDDSCTSTDSFTKLLSGMDKKVGLSTLSSSWKLQNNNQSRFSFARQENLANVSSNDSAAVSRVVKSSSSTQDSYKGGYHNNILLNTIGSPDDILNNGSLFSSNNNAGTLRPNMPAPPGFSVPNRAPPPGFSSQERYVPGYISAASDNLFRASRFPSQIELHPPRNAGDIEFIDPAILAVGKGILPPEVNNSSSLGLNSIIPSHFRNTEGHRIQSLMQQSIAAHQDRRTSYNYNHSSNLIAGGDAYISSRFPVQQINSTSHSPFTHHLRTSNALNSQWRDCERFGDDDFIPMKEEPRFRLSSSNYIYTRRPYGM